MLAIVAGLAVGPRSALQRLLRHRLRHSPRSWSRSPACSGGRAAAPVLGDTGTVNLPPSIITDLTTTSSSPRSAGRRDRRIGAYAVSLLEARRAGRGGSRAGRGAGPDSPRVGRGAIVAAVAVLTRTAASRSPALILVGLARSLPLSRTNALGQTRLRRGWQRRSLASLGDPGQACRDAVFALA